MKKRQTDSEGTQTTAPGAGATPFLSRRAFVLHGSAALAAGATLSDLSPARADEPGPQSSFSLSAGRKKTLAAVQEHLFPAGDDAPGAGDIKALPFLQFVMAQAGFDPDTEHFIVNSIQSLEEVSMERFDARFEELDFDRRELLLRYLADRTRWGRNWLSLLLYYLFEALLADPVYGCNPQGSGWKWLEHQAGFPQPPADKTYPRIMARR